MTSLVHWNAAMSTLTAFTSRVRRLGVVALGLGAVLLSPALARGQATSPTTISVTGGAQPASQTAPTGQVQFGLRVPLKPNAENVLTLTAADATGQTVTVDNLKIAQITLTDVVRAQVTATRLSTPEVRELVAQGVIDIADPANYNVSRFVVVLTVGTQQIEVPVPVVRRIEEPFAEGEAVQIGCGNTLSTSGNFISVPCGDGGGSSVSDVPPIQIVPFEVAPPAPGLPSIPGVIIIEGRIKTLKEFFKVNLLLMNVSSIFTLTDLTARLDVPVDALTPVAPAGGSIALPDIGPGGETTGNFIVRGDTKGVHTVTSYFGGKIVGSFLAAPVPFSGNASTDLEVKGPPTLDVRVSHPDFVVVGQPYDLTVTIENTDPELDALYASMALDVGAGADLLDETTGQLIDGPVTRSLGDILKGQSITQTYTVMPLVSGAIISCVGAADANINLSVAFVGSGPGCAIGTLPSERLNADGKPTVTVVPAHATIDVSPATAIVALFSDQMIQPTITAGYAGAAFTVTDAAGAVVGGTLSFADIFGGTSAIFQPSVPLAPETEYTITVNPSIFNTAGLSLASGIVARFTTAAATATPDVTAPTVSLAVEPPFSATSIARGQSVPIAAQSADARGVTRVDLLLDGELIDAKKGSPSLTFLVETLALTPGSSHVVEARAFDLAGNVGSTTLTLQIAPDLQPPVATILANTAVGQGQVLPVRVQATDDGRVTRVELFLDSAATPFATGLVEPFQFSLDTTGLTGGSHQLRAVAEDGAGNQAQATAAFTVTADSTPPQLALVSPQGTRFRAGSPVPFAAQASDNTALASITYTLDAEAAPRGTGDSFTLDTTGLALGTHVIAIVAADTSNNQTTLTVSFELTTQPVDTTPPPAVVLNALALSPVTGGVVGITGAAGAAEAGARVVFTNLATQAGANAVASVTGTFNVQIEATGGDGIAVVAIDEAGNASPSVTVTVPVPASLVSIAVTPAAVSLSRSNTSESLGVIGTFSDNTQQVLTSGVTYTSSLPNVASVTASGLVLPGINGSAIVTVASSTAGVAPVPVPVTVNFTTVVAISATPNPLALAGLGRSQRLSVGAVYSDNTTGAFAGTVRFATANPNVAVVDGTGLVTSTGIGSTTVTAAATGLPSVPVLVTVSAVQPTDIVVTPTSGSFTTLGQTLQLAVQYRFSDGTTGSASFPVTYQSLDAAVVTVSAAGLVTAAGEGTTSVVVQSQGFTASVPVAVTLPTTLPPPVIASLGRPIAGHGDTLAILGSNFAGVPAQNFVTVNGVRADVVGAADERLVVTVPEGATTGPVQVRVGGQSSNTVEVQVYTRRARAVLETAPFTATPGPGGSVGLGSASVVVYPGDAVVVSGDPFAVTGPQWTAVEAPIVAGTLVLTVNGAEVILTPSGQPIDITSFLPAITQPTRVTLALRVDAPGGTASSRGLAIVAGPPATGAFVGQRFTPADGFEQQHVVRFRTTAADGTLFAASVRPWYRLDGGYSNSSAGGSLLGGVVTPNDGDFRTYQAQGGEVVMTYSDDGITSSLGQLQTAVIALLPANAGGRIGTTPIAEARIVLGAPDSASILPQQTSVLADGVDRPFAVDINSVRDQYGNAITDGARLAVAVRPWYRRSDGGYSNGSAGGTLSGGVVTPNDGDFRTVQLAGGATQVVYSVLGSAILSAGGVDSAVISASIAAANGSRVYTTPFAEGAIVRSAPTATGASLVAVPNALTAAALDNRSVITLSGLTDSLGQPVPDGTRIAVTAEPWYRQSDGGYSNGSFGGAILGGVVSPNDSNFRSFVVTGGQVTFTYSNNYLVLDRSATATTVIAVLPATSTGSRIGATPFAEVRITQAGVASASVVATPSTTLADGTRRPVAVAITNLRDAAGNLVPDGTRVAVVAEPWYRRSDGGYSNGSVGGTILDGVATPNDGSFRTFTVTNGRVDATYSAETVSLLSPNDPRSAVLAVVVASSANDNRVTVTPFAEGTIAVSSVQTANVLVSPTTLYTDRQGRTSSVSLSGLTDAQGVPVPDGTLVAITAQPWYRLSDGEYSNGSFGGTMLGGIATPNDGSFRTYTVAGGATSASYTNLNLFVDVGNTAPVTMAVLPATGSGNRIGTRPFAEATVTLAGADSATFLGSTTVTPSGSLAVTLTNLRDANGNLLPDGAQVAVTAANWYNRNGSFGNGSAGGTISGGISTPNDANFRSFTIAGGQVTFTFNAPGTANVTSVLSVLPADGTGARPALRPFATLSVRVE